MRFCNSTWLQVKMTVCYTKMGIDGGLINILNLPGERQGVSEERYAGKTERTALIRLQWNFLSLGSEYTKYKCFILYWLHFKFSMAGPATPTQMHMRFSLVQLPCVSGCLLLVSCAFSWVLWGSSLASRSWGEMIIPTNTKFWNLKNVSILFQREKKKKKENVA